MKKYVAILLALVMCLSLTACASEDEKAFEAANALMEAGEYEQALEAYYSIELYQKVSEKIYEAEEYLRTQGIDFLVGTWKDLRSDAVVEIKEDGTYKVDDGYGNTWEDLLFYEDDIVYVLGALEVKEEDGILHLTDEYYDLVPEANYEELGPVEIAVTMDNWETYFELKETTTAQTNGFGEIEYISYGCALFLREEYQEKLAREYDGVNVSFKVSYDESLCEVSGDFPNGDYTLVGTVTPPYWYELGSYEDVREVNPYTYEGYEGYELYGRYAADFTIGAYPWELDGVNVIIYPVNYQVLNVTGTMLLFP